MAESDIKILVNDSVSMSSSNPHLMPDFNETAVEDDDFGVFVDEDEMEKEKVEEQDDDSDDDDDDSVSSLQKIGKKSAKSGDIPRNPSWLSFVSRSERNHLLGKEKPPSAEEVRSRKVKFADEPQLETLHEVDQVSPEDKPNYWMNSDDFDRLDNEVKLMKFRWENHKSGKIKLDENTSTIRGLELMLKDPELKKARGVQPWSHARSVLQEIHRQKTEEKEMDWEKVRKESLKSSSVGVENAIVTGKADEHARLRAWDPSIPSQDDSFGSAATSDSSSDAKKKKSKGKGFFSFFGGGKK